MDDTAEAQRQGACSGPLAGECESLTAGVQAGSEWAGEGRAEWDLRLVRPSQGGGESPQEQL